MITLLSCYWFLPCLMSTILGAKNRKVENMKTRQTVTAKEEKKTDYGKNTIHFTHRLSYFYPFTEKTQLYDKASISNHAMIGKHNVKCFPQNYVLLYNVFWLFCLTVACRSQVFEFLAHQHAIHILLEWLVMDWQRTPPLQTSSPHSLSRVPKNYTLGNKWSQCLYLLFIFEVVALP